MHNNKVIRTDFNRIPVIAADEWNDTTTTATLEEMTAKAKRETPRKVIYVEQQANPVLMGALIGASYFVASNVLELLKAIV